MSLRRLLLLLPLSFLSCLASAQFRDGPMQLTKDSLPHGLNGAYWRFSPDALLNGADTALDDSHWKIVSPTLYLWERNSKPEGGFNGEGWMRLHIVTDSTVCNIPLAMRVYQDGGSTIYLDGKLFEKLGKPGRNDDSSEYFNPQGVPLALVFTRPGHHVIAVHYANWDWKRNGKMGSKMAGFSMSIGNANDFIWDSSQQFSVPVAILMALFGLFIALAMTHLILFLYYRAEKSNKLFALFAFSMSCLFLLLVIQKISHSATARVTAHYALILFAVASCITLGTLTTEVLSRRRWPLYVLSVLGVAAIGLGMSVSWGIVLVAVTVVATPVYVVITVVGAIWRRVPGARILGTGVLFFTGTMLYAIVSIIINGDFSADESTLSGQILEFIIMAAILSIPVSMSAYLSWRFATLNRSLKTQLTEVERLSAQALAAEAEKQSLLQNRQQELEREVAERTASLRAEKQKSDDLLLNILPAEIAEELKENGRSEARLYNDVSVLFTDFVGFTQIAESLSPAALVAEIDECFKAFDGIIETHGLEKIKTVGDAYIAVSGMPMEDPAHARNLVAAALEIRDFMQRRKAVQASTFLIRLGVHSGPVVAGIVGVKKFAYDIWGDTVNTSARMEQNSEPGKVNISSATYELAKGSFRCSYRGEIEAKNKGKMGMYFVEGSLAPAI